MSDCKPCTTSVDTQAKVSSDMGAPVSDPTVYCSLAMDLTFTRSDISYIIPGVPPHAQPL
jgi:hypothetical protein